MLSSKKKRRSRAAAVRETDIEPYTALRWMGTIFKAAAIFLVVAILGELVAGLRVEGVGAMPLLLGSLARTLVLAVLLWGAGDVARLLVDVGHDIRAERILLARVAHRLGDVEPTASHLVKVPEEVPAERDEALEASVALIERTPGEDPSTPD